MLEIAQGTQAELMSAYGVSRRMAIRIGAWRHAGILLTPAAAEACAPSSPLETALLDAAWLPPRGADPAAWWDTRAPLAAPLLAAAGLVAIHVGSSVAIGIDEEFAGVDLQAQPDGAQSIRDEPPADLARGVVPALVPSRAIVDVASPGWRGAGSTVTTDEDLASIRVAILTSTDESSQVSALRRLALLEVSAEAKGALMLYALSHGAAPVRAAAAQAFQSVGLSRELTEALALVAAGTETEQRFAVARLQQLVAGASEQERLVLLSAYIGLLQQNDKPALLPEVLRGLAAFGGSLVGVPQLASQLTQLTLRRVLERYTDLSDAAGAFLSSAIAARDPAVGRELHRLVASIPSPEPAIWAVELLTRVEHPVEPLAPLIARAVAVMGVMPDLSRALATASDVLGRWPDIAIPALCEGIEQTAEAEQFRRVQAMHQIALRAPLSPAAFGIVIETLIERLDGAPVRVRNAILEGHLFTAPALPAAERKRVARALVRLYPTLMVDHLRGAAERILIALPESAIPEIPSILTDPVGGGPACHLLGEIVRSADALPLDLLRSTERELEAVIAADSVKDKTRYWIALGKVLGRPEHGAAYVSERIDSLIARLHTTSYAYAVVEALSWIAPSLAISLSHRTELARLFCELLHANVSKFPDVKEINAENETVYHVGAHANFFIELLPTVIRAIARLYESPHAPPPLRKYLLGEVRRKWHLAVEYKVIVGPKNTIDIAEMLTRIGVSNHTAPSDRFDVFCDLGKRHSLATVMPMIARLAAALPRHKGVDEAVPAMLDEWLTLCRTPNYFDVNERITCIRAMLSLSDRRHFGPEGHDHHRQRRSVVDIALMGFQDRLITLRGDLVRIMDSPNFADEDRKRVRRAVPMEVAVRGG